MLEKSQRLGPYEIEAPAGKGGMGEVYRAKDTRLDRTVAIKVLPSHSALNADMKARFEREAKTISSLNHPNVCTLHDVGHENGIDFLVMEFLEGEPLDERLKRGKFETTEALEIGAQIAGALDAAHRKGLVHRDIKPSNIFLTKEGAKLLDFGLAKLQAEAVTGMDDETRTTPVTGAGAIVGTLQYMSPEQLEGTEADARSDIFSFGATIYEMATGQRAFSGDSKASLIGSIMKDEPRAISDIQPTSPPALDRLIKKCLQKDPDDRWQSAKDLKDELDWIASAGSQASVPTPVSSRRRLHLRLSWSLFAVAGVIAILLAVLHFLRTDPVRKTSRLTISTERSFQEVQWPRISPDGNLLAFLSVDSTGTCRIWIRPLNALEAYPLPGTEGAYRPFWSPDSRYLAYFADFDQLKKVPASGGPSQLICEFAGSDGCWSKNGTILFDNALTEPIMQVPAAGGTPTPATTVDTARGEKYHMWPWFLPDGNHFLYLVHRSLTQGMDSTDMIGETSNTLRVGSLDGSVDRELFVSDSRAEYCEPGYILYYSDGVLLARRFDTDRLEVVGEPIPIAENIATGGGSHIFHFSASDDATLVYQGLTAGGMRQIMVVDRNGQELDTLGPPAHYGNVALSPDGKRLAFDMGDDIWIQGLDRGVRSRLTFDGGYLPVWSPDGVHITYAPGRGLGVVMMRRSDGTGAAKIIYCSPRGGSGPTDWSNDGKYVCATSWDQSFDITLVDPLDSSNNVSVLHGNYHEANAQFSPDGCYLVYQSSESGRYEIYICELGDSLSKWQVSSDGGFTPVWRADGREILYWDATGRLIGVPVDTQGGRITLGVPDPVLDRTAMRVSTTNRRYYAVSSDGQRFYINVPAGDDNQMEFVVVLNWDAELEISK